MTGFGQSPKPVCKALTPSYQLIIRDLPDSVESDVIVRATNGSVSPCVYKVASGDWELKGVNVNRFVRFAQPNYLILGGGTGPDGGEFVVYDSKSRKKLFEKGFLGEAIRIDFSTTGGTTSTRVTYTESVGIAKGPAQCKEFAKITAQTLTPTLAADTTITLPTGGNPTRSNQRCIATQ